MPIYEYECPRCGVKFEKSMRISDCDKAVNCDKCGLVAERLYSTFAPKIFEPFTTTNIMEDGSPVTVKGEGHLHQLETDHGVKWIGEDTLPEKAPPFRIVDTE